LGYFLQTSKFREKQKASLRIAISLEIGTEKMAY